MEPSTEDYERLKQLEEDLWREETLDVALVTHESVVAYETGTRYGRRSSLWTRTADGWELRFHQGTAIPEPE